MSPLKSLFTYSFSTNRETLFPPEMPLDVCTTCDVRVSLVEAHGHGNAWANVRGKNCSFVLAKRPPLLANIAMACAL